MVVVLVIFLFANKTQKRSLCNMLTWMKLWYIQNDDVAVQRRTKIIIYLKDKTWKPLFLLPSMTFILYYVCLCLCVCEFVNRKCTTRHYCNHSSSLYACYFCFTSDIRGFMLVVLLSSSNHEICMLKYEFFFVDVSFVCYVKKKKMKQMMEYIIMCV